MKQARTPLTMGRPASRISAWHYPGRNGAWIVAGGLAATKEPATDAHAAVFKAAGYDVVVFDYRHLGTSDGTPRQVVDVGRQPDDWQKVVNDVTTRHATLVRLPGGHYAPFLESAQTALDTQLAFLETIAVRAPERAEP